MTTVLTRSDTCTVVLRGAYDLGNRDRLREQLDGACLHGWATVTVDLAAVTFIDAGAVGLIVRAWNRQRGDGNDLRVVNAQGIVARVFQLCKLDGLLTIDLAWPKGDVQPGGQRHDGLAARNSSVGRGNVNTTS